MPGVVSAGHEETARAAAEVLADGGNAFDAAVAALLVSFVAEPCMSSPGGGGFLLGWNEASGGVLCDFFCQFPRKRRAGSEVDFRPVHVNFGDTSEIFNVGLGAAATPGTIAGVAAIAERLCTLPMARLAESAIRLAREGVVVDWFQHHDFVLLDPILSLDERSREVYLPGGKPRAIGEVLYLPALADVVEALVMEGSRSFYEGEIGQSIARCARERGGHLSADDLATYRAIFREPLVGRRGNGMVLTNPPPSAGGFRVLEGIDVLERCEMTGPSTGPGNADLSFVRKLVRALACGDGTPDEGTISSAQPGEPDGPWGSTTHISVVDGDGSAASISTTNGEGCGCVIPGGDFMLNNMLGERALVPDGIEGWTPNVRVPSMMAPTIALSADGRPEVILGTGGAGRIPFALAQVLHRICVLGTDVEGAVAAPRLHWDAGVLNAEPGWFAPGTVAAADIDDGSGAVREVVNFSDRDMFFGGVHAIARQIDVDTGEKHWSGAGDERRNGVSYRVD